ncbi:histidine phosphatase family protein [Winogradskyella sp. J14-2]|uniref:SixA phosphatase family protein n=1 Tax=Winogradskyella sp. J14-2 TaxID=1936080 RepID=UPI0009729BE5|nr:histidine phosphatase family protein [Winogradskyella sp. J14-2]APY07020.1 histidine phosphatase family protein [Winogradskyella sp. J14-2]
MKSITLVRHGKSSWELDVSDALRPLKIRGVNDAKLVANQFVKLNELPNFIYSSSAVRAFSTCKIFLEVFNLSEDSVCVTDELYDFGGERVVNFIKRLSSNYNSVMLFGHNHAFTSIANIFGDKFIDNLPTSGLIKINFDISNWKDLKQGTTELIIIPKELRHDKI